MSLLEDAEVLLLDIEGTIAPVSFVFEVLFPYAAAQVETFLEVHGKEPLVQADLAALRDEYEADTGRGLILPDWSGPEPTAATPYIRFLIAADRKSTGLKSLQGKIWEQGYLSGAYRSQIFADVRPAFERWTRAGKRIYIYSSGSIQAQRLLFEHTEQGDLRGYLSRYFDTTSGPKLEADSYRRIAGQIAVDAAQILFASDHRGELRAAQQAGLRTVLVVRPGNALAEGTDFPVVRSFAPAPAGDES
ncbi:acireductone synthase [Gloeobacter kilaueensis]|uniref:Enolase-phosphatase E1 n=1 Tax=Gloeobacter kilaueensis (strain ATCC BAA-2537 / CCAP 1431/1 / ULC 316 / JS1) TaxID=1183438 RepID=U5QP70_GLOK1|nr:acireductone synthase [Gloeobacter kilaueensis]AGY59364.1 2,3-diketo-5-methylthio-1-phosphopentane phosphatase [Gloeobacter kilaueensis JS1]